MVAPLILIPFLLLFASIGEADDYMAYKDATKPVEVRVKDLLSRMTLAEKIGQMTQIERVVATTDVLKNYYIGGREWDHIDNYLNDGNEPSVNRLWLLAVFIFNWSSSQLSFPNSNHLFQVS